MHNKQNNLTKELLFYVPYSCISQESNELITISFNWDDWLFYV